MNNATCLLRPHRATSVVLMLCATLLGACSESDSNDSTNAADDGTPTAGSPADEPQTVPGEAGNGAGDAPTSGDDPEGQTAADDYSPTQTESLSLAGPSVVEPERGDGPPSAPADLTALLTSYDWVLFSWVPSVDDKSVTAYEIYRNGELIHTLSGDNEAERTQWLSTNWMDCNYTKNAACVTGQPVPGSSNDYYVVAVDGEGLRSTPSETVTLPLLETTTSSIDISEYTLVFEEEFTGEQLDRSKWRTSMAWGADDIINGEMQYFVDIFKPEEFGYDPFVFNGETLTIEGIRTPPELSEKALGQPYLSGVISTLDYFNMTYGYVEARAKLASSTGMLSTFYLFNDNFERNKPEIDIVEYNGGEPTIANQTYHYYDSNKNRDYRGEKHSSPTMKVENGPDYSADFHTYAVRWEPGLAIWYIDGVEVQRIAGPRISDEPMHIVSHLVVGSEWIGAPDDSTVFPGRLELDYIRAYELP